MVIGVLLAELPSTVTQVMKAHFEMFADYNRWANGLLYDAVATMEDDAYRRDEGLFFGSVHATLNHLLVADTIWMARFRQQSHAPMKLNHIMHDAFDALREARRAMDDEIVEWMSRQSDSELAANFTYTPVTNPEPVTQGVAPALAHVFNHQTHHRGQIHGVVTRRTELCPEMDLIYYQRHKRLGLI